jgi:hypothetical protein
MVAAMDLRLKALLLQPRVAGRKPKRPHRIHVKQRPPMPLVSVIEPPLAQAARSSTDADTGPGPTTPAHH